MYGHLFKVEKLYNSIKQGVYYPLYVKNWYSGLELFRYWPPLAYYFCCIFMFLFDNIYTAYLCFIGSTFVIGATGWLLFGYKENKLLLATIFGILYMMLPDNMRVLLTEDTVEVASFTSIEKVIENIIEPYQDKLINEIAPFDKVSPTVENMCIIFKTVIDKELLKLGWKLLAISLSETPSRSFVITVEQTFDSDVTYEDVIKQLEDKQNVVNTTNSVSDSDAISDSDLPYIIVTFKDGTTAKKLKNPGPNDYDYIFDDLD